jgi:PAS domain S-box-containing protein
MNKVYSSIIKILRRSEFPLYLILFIGVISLLGWLSGEMGLAAISSAYIPIAPITAMIFIILCILSLVNHNQNKSLLINSLDTFSLIIIALFCGLTFLNHTLNFTWDIENIFIKNPKIVGSAPIGHMSPITAALVIIICIINLLKRYNNLNIFKYAGGSLSLIIFLVSSVIVLGYLYRAPLLYGSTLIPVSLPAAVCLLLFSITLIRIYDLRFWTFNLFKVNQVSLQLLKWFLPIVVFSIVLFGYLVISLSTEVQSLTPLVAIIALTVTILIVLVVIKVSENIGEKLHRAEQSVRESEEKFSRAIQFAPFPIMIHAENGRVLAISQGWKDLSGYTLDDIPTIEAWTERAYGTQMHIVKEDIDALYKMEGSKNEGEYTVLCKDRTERIWDFSSAFLGNFEIGGRVVISMAKDVTERKKAEDALKLNEKQLTSINADKDRFISILGHDLKNPFNNILGFSEVLTNELEGLNKEEIRDIARNINKSAQITSNLLDDILLWSRSQQGSIIFNPQNLQFEDICNDAIRVLLPNANSKNIDISYSIADQLNVFADADMLKTILRNLVSNAVKFTKDGGKINISTEQTDSEITISVSDNGIGIPLQNQSKLFDISEVLTTKGTAGETGTGLGLLLCKEFVEKHGGKIWVESEVGKGSVFKFTLP